MWESKKVGGDGRKETQGVWPKWALQRKGRFPRTEEGREVLVVIARGSGHIAVSAQALTMISCSRGDRISKAISFKWTGQDCIISIPVMPMMPHRLAALPYVTSSHESHGQMFL